ncbi:MAG: glycosyltransferase family 4 protein [Candidatus Zixiibacteriota bacterium]
MNRLELHDRIGSTGWYQDATPPLRGQGCPLKVAIVHDWLVTYGGAERVLEHMLEEYPDADLYSLCNFLPEAERSFLLHKPVTTSFIQKLPFARYKYRSYLPLMPLAVERFDLRGYDLVISSSYAVAKGVITGPDQLHVCMCYSPMRYAWDLTHQYLAESGLSNGLRGMLAHWLLYRLRQWDYRTANGVDEFIAISRYIARRIMKVYRRPATIIYPPVDVDRFSLREHKEDFYLTASRLVPYKRIDLIVESFSHMRNKQLVVIGDGPEWKKVKRKASPNVHLLGHQPFDILCEQMQRARAFIFAAEEDFGIVPVEAQACGTPVIAFGRGGATETIVDGETGLFFDEQTVPSLVDAINRFEAAGDSFDPRRIRRQAVKFSGVRFKREFHQFMTQVIDTRFGGVARSHPALSS